MSFNKRNINKDGIENALKISIDYLIKYIRTPDCIIIEDEFSKMVCDIVINNDKSSIIEELKKIGLHE